MKTLWNVVSFLAVVHLLAIAMFIGWLWQSDRLDGERIEMLRETFSVTVTEAQLAALEREQEMQAEQEREEYERWLAQSPMSSAQLVERVDRLQQFERQALRRIADAKQFHDEQFELAMQNIERREHELQQARQQWDQSIEDERERREDEQFAKTVRQYESIPPRQGKEMMLELIAAGKMNQAVAYLDAMNVRAASKILQEFRTEQEIQLATKLLEELRRFGLDAEHAQDFVHANDLAATP